MIAESMESITDLDLEASTGLKRLTEIEGVNADMEIKIEHYENEVNGFMTSISTNSESIASSM